MSALRQLLEKSNLLKQIFGYNDSNNDKKIDNIDEIKLSIVDGDPYNAVKKLSALVDTPTDRLKRYEMYDEMDKNSLISLALDLYAEEATLPDRESNVVIWVESTNKKVKDILDELFDRVHIQDLAMSINRNNAKFGDGIEFLPRDKNIGVLALVHQDPKNIIRVDDGLALRGFIKKGIDYKKLNKPSDALHSDPYDYIHFRVRGKTHSDDVLRIYGTSLIDAAVRAYQFLDKADLSSLLYRMKKMPDRLLFKVPVGSSAPEDMYKSMLKFIRVFNKNYMLNASGMNQEFNPFSPAENIVFPQGKDKEGDVSILSGSNNINDIRDVQYYRQNLSAVTRIPLSAFGAVQDGYQMSGKSLAQQDIGFSRIVNRLRQSFFSEINKLCQIELAIHDIHPGMADFTLNMAPISTLETQQLLEYEQIAYETADRAARLFDSLRINTSVATEYILTHHLSLDKSTVEKMMTDMNMQSDTEDDYNLSKSAVDTVISNNAIIKEKINYCKNNISSVIGSFRSSNVDIDITTLNNRPNYIVESTYEQK